MTYKLIIDGFKTIKHVEAFASWYEGSGEQDASYWFEARKEEIDVETMNVRAIRTEGNNVLMTIEVE